MTPTPPTSHSSQSPDKQFRVVRKRNRVPVSCGPCRHKKLKCNRAHPCDNCTKRGDSSSCSYAAPGGRRKLQSSGSNNSPDEMQNRIDRLEGLVLSLMTNGQQSAGPAAASAALTGSTRAGSIDPRLDSDASDVITEEVEGDDDEVDEVAKSIGVMKVENNKSLFISEAHWYAILGEISEVKNYFVDHKKQVEEQFQKFAAARSEDQPGTAYLFGNRSGEAEAVRAAFPQKHVCDGLISMYFNGFDPAMHVIHGPTFQKQYDRHWMMPGETPIVWLGQVFAMMCIALQTMSRTGEEPVEYGGQSASLADEYRKHCARALRTAELGQPTTTMIDTLLLYVKVEQGRSKDTEAGVVIVITILVRLAMKMGYHRDPAPYPALTPFQGEMRRRVWTAVRQADLVAAAQAGFPPIVRPRDTDTALPRNVYDDELYEEMKVLPASRPTSEVTPTSFIIAKGALISILGEIVDETQTLKCCNYEEIMRLDQRLRALHAATPPHLQLRPIDESLLDSPDLTMQRFVLQSVYLKCLCNLHRRFIAMARQNPRFSYSRRTCIDAALELLQHHTTVIREVSPGGRLFSVSWIPSALNAQDYLVAAMMIALDLHHVVEAERAGRVIPNDVYTWSQERRDQMMAAIEHSVAFWSALREISMDAFKAHASLSVMLEKLRPYQQSRASAANFNNGNNDGGRSGSGSGSGPVVPTGYCGTPLGDTQVAPEHSAAMTLGLMSTGAMSPNTAGMFEASKSQYPASLGNLLNDPGPGAMPSTGLSPQFTGSGTFANQAGPSAFSMFGGGSLGLQSMDIPSSNIDWDAWDSYIQGSTGLDTNSQFWPMNMNMDNPLSTHPHHLDTIVPSQQQQTLQSQQHQPQQHHQQAGQPVVPSSANVSHKQGQLQSQPHQQQGQGQQQQQHGGGGEYKVQHEGLFMGVHGQPPPRGPGGMG